MKNKSNDKNHMLNLDTFNIEGKNNVIIGHRECLIKKIVKNIVNSLPRKHLSLNISIEELIHKLSDFIREVTPPVHYVLTDEELHDYKYAFTIAKGSNGKYTIRKFYTYQLEDGKYHSSGLMGNNLAKPEDFEGWTFNWNLLFKVLPTDLYNVVYKEYADSVAIHICGIILDNMIEYNPYNIICVQ